MPSLETLILRDLIAAHQRTLMHVQALAPDRDSASAIAACHGHLVAQRDLYKVLHELVPGQRLRFAQGRGVAADSEGGVHWILGHRHPWDAAAFSSS